MHHRHAHRRRNARGSAYVAVLGVCVFVSLVGLTGLVLARVERRATEAGREGLLAQQLAASALELALLEAQNPTWRSGRTSGAWTPGFPLGAGTVRYRYIDPADGNLGDDPLEPARAEAEATVGGAVRRLKAQLVPDAAAGSNLLVNGGFESTVSPWIARNCQIERTADAQSGSGALRVHARAAATSGAAQSITDLIRNGATYRLIAWVRTSSDPPAVRITLHHESTGDGVKSCNAVASTVVGVWTRVEMEVTPTWTGTLTHAEWRIETSSGTGEFLVDGAALVPQAAGSPMTLQPGSIARQMLP